MNLFTTDLRNSVYTGHTLPPQALPTKEKEMGSTSKEVSPWKKACMDALENIALRQIYRKQIAFDDSLRILQGDFRYKDVVNSSAFLSEVDFLRSQTNIKDELKHFGFIEPIVNHLIGEYLKMPDPITIYADDPFSTNDYIQAKTDKLWEATSQQVEDMLNLKMIKQGINPFEEEFESPEAQQQYLQQIEQFKQQNTPKSIEKYMNQNWRAVYIEWAEATLKSDYSNFDIDELDRNDLYFYLATGQCFRHFMIGYDYYAPETWHPRETFSDDTVTNVEDGEYVGQLKYVSANELIGKWGHLMSEDVKRAILKAKDFDKDILHYNAETSPRNIFDWATKGGGNVRVVPHPHYYPYQNGRWLQEELGINLGFPQDDFPNGGRRAYTSYFTDSERIDLIRYIYGYWVSYQRIGYLTLFDEQIGEPVTQKVTDEILRELIKEYGIKQLRTVSLEEHEKDPKPNTIVWDYLKQVWRGLKVCKENTDLDEDLYLGIEPLPYQVKGVSQLYHVKLPVCGITEPTSFVSRMEEEQKLYNIALNMSADYMAKELGIFFVMDTSFMPSWLKDYGGEEALVKLTEVIKASGILPGDGEFSKSSFNQWQQVNMDLTAAMLGKLQYAQIIKQQAYEKIGFTPERLGTPTPNNKTATGINQATTASINQTAVWFDKFSKFQKRYNELHLSLAQFVKSDGKDVTVNYVDDYKTRTFISMNDPNLPMRRLRISVDANSRKRSELDIIKQTYYQDNTIEKNLEDLASVISADSVSKVIQLARYGRQLAQIQQEKLQQQELQKIQAEQEGEFKREEAQRQWDARENDLDRQKEILKAKIVALGFDKEDTGGGKEIVDEANRALEQLKLRTEQRKIEMDNQQKKSQSEKDERMKNRELDIKEREALVKERAVTIPLEVAQENRTAAEISAQTKQKEANKKKKK